MHAIFRKISHTPKVKKKEIITFYNERLLWIRKNLFFAKINLSTISLENLKF